MSESLLADTVAAASFIDLSLLVTFVTGILVGFLLFAVLELALWGFAYYRGKCKTAKNKGGEK